MLPVLVGSVAQVPSRPVRCLSRACEERAEFLAGELKDDRSERSLRHMLDESCAVYIFDTYDWNRGRRSRPLSKRISQRVFGAVRPSDQFLKALNELVAIVQRAQHCGPRTDAHSGREIDRPRRVTPPLRLQYVLWVRFLSNCNLTPLDAFASRFFALFLFFLTQ